MNIEESQPEECLNCGASLSGPFCSECGQPKTAQLAPLNEWLGDFLDTFLNLDSKLLRTIKKILFQPGLATVDFGKGKRVPYSSPLKVYIIVSAISFAVMTLQSSFGTNAFMPGGNGAQQSIQLLFPVLNLLSPFITAAIMSVVQSKFYFQLHLAFSLHYWIFFIAITTPMIFIPATTIWALVGFSILCIVCSIYLFLAHKAVYVASPLERFVAWCAIQFSVLFAGFVFSFLLFAAAAMLR